MERGGSYVFTLAANGGICNLHVTSLNPLDSLLQIELSSRINTFTQQQLLRYSSQSLEIIQYPNYSQQLARLKGFSVQGLGFKDTSKIFSRAHKIIQWAGSKGLGVYDLRFKDSKQISPRAHKIICVFCKLMIQNVTITTAQVLGGTLLPYP